MCWCPDDSGVTLCLNLAFLPKILPINFGNQWRDLAAFSEGEPVECFLVCSVLAVWYYLDSMTAIQSSDQLLIHHGGRTQGALLSN